MFRQGRVRDAVLLEVPEEVHRGCVEQLCDVLRVVTPIWHDVQSLDNPVLLQVLRVIVMIERPQPRTGQRLSQ